MAKVSKQSRHKDLSTRGEFNRGRGINSDKTVDKENEFKNAVESRRRRKLKSKAEGKIPPLFGLGMFGVIGWSIVLTTLTGIAIGVWIDDTWPSQISWTVTMLFVGVTIGCANAWYWLNRKSFL